MKIINKTIYDTRYLRRLFLECEKHIFATYLKHGESKHRKVTIKYGRFHNNCGVSGYAYYKSCTMAILLPRPRPPIIPISKLYVKARIVAQTYLHEVGHNIGIHHNQMGTITKYGNWDISWWPDELVPTKVIAEKPKPNIIELRAAKAQRKLEEWENKVKRAGKLVKKYRQQVRYYESKMAALKNRVV